MLKYQNTTSSCANHALSFPKHNFLELKFNDFRFENCNQITINTTIHRIPSDGTSIITNCEKSRESHTVGYAKLHNIG